MRISLLGTALVALALTACGGADPSLEGTDDAADSLSAGGSNAATTSYFTVRHDFRRCVSPLCGGYWVKPVNDAAIRCAPADRTLSDECYVAEIDLKALRLDGAEVEAFRGTLGDGHTVLRGRVGAKRYSSTWKLGYFTATEGYEAATAATPAGALYRVKSTGIVCVTTPCPSFHAAKLNTAFASDFSVLDLRTVPGITDAQVSEASDALATEGILVASQGLAPLAATQLWTRVRHECKPTPITLASSELRGADFSNKTRDTDATPAVYERHYRFDRVAGTVTVEDLIAPCPPGVMCLWSGIVSQTATYTVNGDKLELRYAPDTTNGWGLVYYKELAGERACTGARQLVEVANDGTGRRREFTK